MLKAISRFCSGHPRVIIALVALITAIMGLQIFQKSYFEADLTKFIPKDLPAVKSDDYYKKNFNYQDNMIIGIERKNGSVMEPEVLRRIEAITLALKNLKATKTIKSKLKGETVDITLSVGIDPDSVSSIANVEDAVLDKQTGSVTSGSIIKKLKDDLGISSEPGMEERLPASDTDLKALIPALEQRLLSDRNYRGSLLSEDLNATAIRVGMYSKWTQKKRYSIRELSVALDIEDLTNRFKGNDPSFPFMIYGKTIDRITIDDEYIAKQVAETRKEVRDFFVHHFDDGVEVTPILREILANELTKESFLELMIATEESDFFVGPEMGTWSDFCTEIYAFTLDQIDPFSRENLELQLYNAVDIFEFSDVYTLSQEVFKKYELEGTHFYIAGLPVVIGVITMMMQQDLMGLVPIAVIIVLVVLVVSFRSVRGVVIPALTVILAVVWTLGIMATVGIPFSMITVILPIVLFGIGTAYGIHFLNRFYEDARDGTDVREIIQKSITHVGVAVVMAAITTMVGFSSLATSKISAIQHFGIFSAVGVFISLLLTLTFSPALLVLWPLPKNSGPLKPTANRSENSLVAVLMRKWALLVIARPKTVIVVLGLLVIGSLGLMNRNYFEGSMMANFGGDNELNRSDVFINKNLSGTTNISLLFKFRDQINLVNAATAQELKDRIAELGVAWNQFADSHPRLASTKGLVAELQTFAVEPSANKDLILERIQLIQDILNEEYVFESVSEDFASMDLDSLDTLEAIGENRQLEPIDTLDDLGALADDSLDSLDDLAGLSDMTEVGAVSESAFSSLSTGQVNGLKHIQQRWYGAETGWEDTGELILELRRRKSSPSGVLMVRQKNLLSDFFAVDIKQPVVLRKLNELDQYLKGLKEPTVYIEGKGYDPTGFIMTPVDFVRKFYRVFYHDDNPAYDRLPDVTRDGFEDKTLTDRSIIGVVLNQALSASRENFETVMTPNLKEFQVQMMIRSDTHDVIETYISTALEKVTELFPEDDPYIERVMVGGSAPTGNALNMLLARSQMQTIVLSFVLVFFVTFFIFRSVWGGLYSLVPLAFTVILNFGLIALIGGMITTPTMMVAAIAIGTGVDYTIHFLERLKIQLRAGNTLAEAYIYTVLTSGRAIMVNAVAVALGFLVLIFSSFAPEVTMGILMAATMGFSSLGALTLLPALIFITKPKFLGKSLG